jgi:hypothetical protein
MCGDAVVGPPVVLDVASLMSYGGSLARIERSFKKRVRRVCRKDGETGVEVRVVDVEGGVVVVRSFALSMFSDSNSTVGTGELFMLYPNDKVMMTYIVVDLVGMTTSGTRTRRT